MTYALSESPLLPPLLLLHRAEAPLIVVVISAPVWRYSCFSPLMILQVWKPTRSLDSLPEYCGGCALRLSSFLRQQPPACERPIPSAAAAIHWLSQSWNDALGGALVLTMVHKCHSGHTRKAYLVQCNP